MRKHLLEYDDVLNKQRIAVYKRRNEILTSFEKKVLAEKVREAILGHLEKINQQVEISENPIETWEEIKKTILTAKIVPNDFSWGELGEIENVREEIARQSEEIAGQPQTINRLLGILDMLWLNHLENNEALSESIGLRAYGQHDPLVEYRRESHRLFTEFWDMFNAWVFENIFRLAEATNDQQLITNNQNVPVTSHQSSVVSSPTGEKVGRNDPCPCGATNTDGSPKKYKHCHGK